MNAITDVRNEAVRSCLKEGFSLQQIGKVIQLGEKELLQAQLEMSVELIGRSPEAMRRKLSKGSLIRLDTVRSVRRIGGMNE